MEFSARRANTSRSTHTAEFSVSGANYTFRKQSKMQSFRHSRQHTTAKFARKVVEERKRQKRELGKCLLSYERLPLRPPKHPVDLILPHIHHKIPSGTRSHTQILFLISKIDVVCRAISNNYYPKAMRIGIPDADYQADWKIKGMFINAIPSIRVMNKYRNNVFHGKSNHVRAVTILQQYHKELRQFDSDHSGRAKRRFYERSLPSTQELAVYDYIHDNRREFVTLRDSSQGGWRGVANKLAHGKAFTDGVLDADAVVFMQRLGFSLP